MKTWRYNVLSTGCFAYRDTGWSGLSRWGCSVDLQLSNNLVCVCEWSMNVKCRSVKHFVDKMSPCGAKALFKN
jgi:hypothetical protein